jgi:deoxyribose-phosphate aldolase
VKTAVAMLEAGADRIGTSASTAIMEEWLARRQ